MINANPDNSVRMADMLHLQQLVSILTLYCRSRGMLGFMTTQENNKFVIR